MCEGADGGVPKGCLHPSTGRHGCGISRGGVSVLQDQTGIRWGVGEGQRR